MPEHSRIQVSDASAELVKTGVPALAGRSYPELSLDWDRRSYPMAVHAITGGTVELVGDNGRGERRLQKRQFRLTIEIHAEEIVDIGRELMGYVADIEAILIPANFPLPVEDIEYLGDTGVIDIRKSETSIISAIAMSFLVTCHTFEGDPCRLVDPENPETTYPSRGDIFDV